MSFFSLITERTAMGANKDLCDWKRRKPYNGFNSWQEIIEIYDPPLKLNGNGSAYNSKHTKEQLRRKLGDGLARLHPPTLSLLIFKDLIDLQNSNTGQLNVTNDILAEKTGRSKASVERALTWLYSNLPKELFFSVKYNNHSGFILSRRQIIMKVDELLRAFEGGDA